MDSIRAVEQLRERRGTMSEEPSMYGKPIEEQPPNPWSPLSLSEGELLSKATLQERVDFAVRELERAEILLRADLPLAEPKNSTQAESPINLLPVSNRMSRAVSALKIREFPRPWR